MYYFFVNSICVSITAKDIFVEPWLGSKVRKEIFTNYRKNERIIERTLNFAITNQFDGRKK